MLLRHASPVPRCFEFSSITSAGGVGRTSETKRCSSNPHKAIVLQIPAGFATNHPIDNALPVSIAVAHILSAEHWIRHYGFLTSYRRVPRSDVDASLPLDGFYVLATLMGYRYVASQLSFGKNSIPASTTFRKNLVPDSA